jgi:hypothetical protein
MRGIGISQEAMRSLSKALSINCTLTALDLLNNGIGVPTAEILSEVLSVNRGLRSLILANNFLSDIGTYATAFLASQFFVMRIFLYSYLSPRSFLLMLMLTLYVLCRYANIRIEPCIK